MIPGLAHLRRTVVCSIDARFWKESNAPRSWADKSSCHGLKSCRRDLRCIRDRWELHSLLTSQYTGHTKPSTS